MDWKKLVEVQWRMEIVVVMVRDDREIAKKAKSEKMRIEK